MSTKFSQLDESLARLVKKIEGGPKDYTLLATKYAEGIFKQRVFNVGGAKDINGSIVHSGYSPAYKKKMNKRSNNWDLHATGDLRDSIKVVTKSPKKKTVLEFVDDDQIKKADGLEDKSGKVIFEMSKKETDETLKYITKVMLQDIRKIVQESFK